jgi:hypothetical protein
MPGSPGLRVFCQFLEKNVPAGCNVSPEINSCQLALMVPSGDRNSNEWNRGIAADKTGTAKDVAYLCAYDWRYLGWLSLNGSLE